MGYGFKTVTIKIYLGKASLFYPNGASLQRLFLQTAKENPRDVAVTCVSSTVYCGPSGGNSGNLSIAERATKRIIGLSG